MADQETLGSLYFDLDVRDKTAGTTLRTTGQGFDDYERKAKNAQGTTKGFDSTLKNMALGMLGANGIVAALQTAKRVISENITEALNLNAAMGEVSTLFDSTTSTIATMTNEVQALAGRYGQDSGGLASALYQTISAGVDAAESIKFLETATKAAVGGVATTEQAVDALTSTLNAFGLDTEEVGNVADSFFTTIKFGKTTMSELSSSIGMIAPMASAVGASVDEMNASLATLTKSGLSTAEAGTALRGIFNAIIKPQEQALEAAKLLNVEWGVKGVESAGGFANFMQILNEKTEGSSEILSQLFPDVRGLNGALILAGQGSEEFAEGMELMADKTGNADEALQKISDTMAHRYKQRVETIKQITMDAGGAIASFFDKILIGWEGIGIALSGNESALERLREQVRRIEGGDEVELTPEQRAEAEKERNKKKEDAERRKRESKERMKELEERYAQLKKNLEVEKDHSKVLKELEKINDEIAQAIRDRMEAENDIAQMSIEMSIKEKEEIAKNEDEKKVIRKRANDEVLQQKIQMFSMERDYQLEVLAMETEARMEMVKGNQEALDEIEQMYIVKSQLIGQTWTQNVANATINASKTDKQIFRADIDIQEKMDTSFDRSVHGFETAMTAANKVISEDFKKGIIDNLGEIVGELGGSLDEVLGGVLGEDYGGIVGILTGAFEFGWNIGEAIYNAVNEEEIIAEKQKEAANKMLDAADSFSQATYDYLWDKGYYHLEGRSYNELEEMQQDLEDRQVEAYKNLGIGGDIAPAQLARLAALLEDEEEADLFKTLMEGYSGKNTAHRTHAEAKKIYGEGSEIPYLLYHISKRSEETGDQLYDPLMDVLYGSDYREPLREIQEKQNEMIDRRTVDTEPYLEPSLINHQTFSQAEEEIGALKSGGKITDLQYAEYLWRAAQYFWQDIDPERYWTLKYNYENELAKSKGTNDNVKTPEEEALPVFDDGGISTGPALVGLDYQPELHLPLSKPDRIAEILSGIGSMGGGQIGGVAKIEVYLDKTLSGKAMDTTLGEMLSIRNRSQGLGL